MDMILIYWKNKVGSAVAELCDYLGLVYEMRDDSDTPDSFGVFDIIIPSPGIPGTHQIYQTGKIVSELDFAYRYMPRWFRIISITGTDGKSTTSWIMYNILQKEYFVKENCNKTVTGSEKKFPVYLSGNFDIPFSATVLDILKKWEKKWYIVVEISSFMSYMIREFVSDFSIFTNFKSDHLNWHRDLQEYLEAKMNLLLHTKKRAVLNQQVVDFGRESNLRIEIPKNSRIFSQSMDCFVPRNDEKRDWTDGENIVISGRKKYRLSETHFSGFHNAMNLLSVGIIAHEMKICSKRVKKYISEIYGLPHRLERIWEKNGVIFVEDSKSTSSQSLEAALGSYAPMNNEQWTMNTIKNLLMIVGGSDKWDSFSHLGPKFQERVKAMACIGVTKEKFVEIAKKENIPYIATDTLEEAVSWLYEESSKWDVLMLSPGCASFWLFRDYLDRANQFREIIQKIPD
jgi:UDP-N-acetylmuramoylalanine--D-glutamate ligase